MDLYSPNHRLPINSVIQGITYRDHRLNLQDNEGIMIPFRRALLKRHHRGGWTEARVGPPPVELGGFPRLGN